MKRTSIAVAALTLPAVSASAQSFNIEWGSIDSAPPATYGAVGLPGVWNTFDAMPEFTRLPLVGLDGSPIAADIMNIGFDFIESAAIPGAARGDAALLNDCFTSQNDPVDGCIFIRFVEPGEYRVIMYAIAPDDPELLNRLRIDQNTEPPEFVGGPWSGVHEPGITYMEQIATVGTNGRLDVHSGLFGGNIRSVMNGMQVISLADEVCVADLAEPFGVLNFFDLGAFLTLFNEQDAAVDLAAPFGVWNFFDLGSYLEAFNAGCP